MSKRSRNKADRYTRKVATRDPVERFLIVCEGEKTEVYYFKEFRVPKKVEPVVHGSGNHTIRVVEEAIELMKADEYDQVWCVFDRDSFTAHDFNYALITAKQNNIQVAYSNEAFELWYLLHFHFYTTAISRSEYCKKLDKLLEKPYSKNTKDMFEQLKPYQNIAIKHAQRLLERYNPPHPEQDNPSTTVHLLVQQLIKNSR